MTHVEYEWENPTWRRQVEGMGTRFSYVRYDGRGMGLSDRDVSDFSMEALGGDLEAVVNALGFEKVALLGISQGGAVAIRYATRHPERVSHLIVYGSGAVAEGSRAEELQTMVSFIRQGWDSDVAAFRQFFTGLFIPDADMDAIQAFNEMQRLSTSGDNVIKMFTAQRPTDAVADLLPHVAVPTLIIHRRGDAMVPFEQGRELAAGIPGARFLPLDGRNHAPLAESDIPVLETMASAIAEFIGDAPAANQPITAAPSDVRTILFTDLVGHTEMMSRLGDEKGRDVLREHERITREVLKANGGTEVKTMGDGFLASFGSVTKAVECAVALQRAFEEWNADVGATGRSPLSVRVGLNAGEPIEEDGDLFGATVILASRIAAKAAGGEILVADTVRGLCSGKGFLFADRGEFVAKGFEEPVRVYEVRWRE
jgi:class 3 adenylate cyclase